MIRHFFLDKTNTIIKGSFQNTGLNPVLSIGYGNGVERGLIHFDLDDVKELIEDKTFASVDKLKFTLKMTNCFSVDGLPYEKDLMRGLNVSARRAASFDLILFKLPCDFDGGRGFDFLSDFWVRDNRSYSKEGSSWYFCKSGIPWAYEMGAIDLNDRGLNWADVENRKIRLNGGIYDNETLIEEYEKFSNCKDSIIVGEQHFDFGNENLSIDVTDYVMECVKNNVNYGLGLAFAPRYEAMDTPQMQYVGFITDTTNTFFHPYLEAEYSEYIRDDRESFTVGRDNRLYLYVSDDGQPVNLDTVPKCTVDEQSLTVKQATKGVYYALISASSSTLDAEAVYYDNWSEIALNGVKNEDVELEFATSPSSRKVRMGSESAMKNEVVPSIYGINDDERLTRDEVREVIVDFRQKYSTDKKILIDSGEYRIYVKDGAREYDVIKYQPIEKAYLNNFFIIYTKDLIPNEYYIDVRVKRGRETLMYKNVLKFTIVSNVTERYE